MSHRKILKNLEAITRDAEISVCNLTYKNRVRDVGEIDHLVYNQGILWVYEVKSNSKMGFAKKQLRRHTVNIHRIREALMSEYGIRLPKKIRKLHAYFVTGQKSSGFSPEVYKVKL